MAEKEMKTPPKRVVMTGMRATPAPILYRESYDKDGKVLVRLEYYHELDPENRRTPKVYESFKRRMNAIHRDGQGGVVDDITGMKLATLVDDSETFRELVTRKYYEHVVNPNAETSWDWRRSCTDSMEQTLMMKFAGLPCNVIVVCHTDPETDKFEGGVIRYNPRAPGRLRRDLSAAFSEFYHLAVVEQGEKVERVLYTEPTGKFAAATRIHAPNLSIPHYAVLFGNRPKPWPNIHVLIYGESGSGKSTFAATFPTPILVFVWDPFGKDEPYLEVPGTASISGMREMTFDAQQEAA